MEVTYSEDKKHAYFNGKKYTKDDNTGYYLSSARKGKTGTRIHRDVWEFYNCKIPKGYHVHHIDHDKGNNDISNLQLLEAREHYKLHGAELTEEQRERMRRNVLENALPKSIEWHKTEAGKRWHKEHYERTKDKLYQKATFSCEYCGKEFEAFVNGSNRFCSNACKSAWRRKSGLDDVEKVCPVCGKTFKSNKYSKIVCCSRGCANTFRSRRKQ